MQDLVRTCRQAGVLVAPHDNYIDFYPDAAGFSYHSEIAFDAPGIPVRAWLNEGCGAQSYRGSERSAFLSRRRVKSATNFACHFSTMPGKEY